MKTSPFLFLGISGLQLIIHNHMIHLQKEQNSNIYLWLSRVIKYAITLEKLTNSNLWVNLRRSHSRGFGWPLWVTVASTRNNLQIIIISCESNKPKMFLQSQLLAEYLSTRSNCSFSEISRVSTWNKVQLKAYDRQYHLKSKKHHHDDGAWGGKTLPSEARGSSTVGVTGQWPKTI